MESDIVTPESRNAEIERIHTEAVGTVLYAAMQIFASISSELRLEMKKHGYDNPQLMAISGKAEEEASGLIESLKASLADDLPVDPENAVEKHDDFDILSEDDVCRVGAMVRKTFRDLMGVYDNG
jgi:hypothetical protein